MTVNTMMDRPDLVMDLVAEVHAHSVVPHLVIDLEMPAHAAPAFACFQLTPRVLLGMYKILIAKAHQQHSNVIQIYLDQPVAWVCGNELMQSPDYQWLINDKTAFSIKASDQTGTILARTISFSPDQLFDAYAHKIALSQHDVVMLGFNTDQKKDHALHAAQAYLYGDHEEQSRVERMSSMG